MANPGEGILASRQTGERKGFQSTERGKIRITMSVSMRSTYSLSLCTRVASWTSCRCTGPKMSSFSCNRRRLGPTCSLPHDLTIRESPNPPSKWPTLIKSCTLTTKVRHTTSSDHSPHVHAYTSIQKLVRTGRFFPVKRQLGISHSLHGLAMSFGMLCVRSCSFAEGHTWHKP